MGGEKSGVGWVSRGYGGTGMAPSLAAPLTARQRLAFAGASSTSTSPGNHCTYGTLVGMEEGGGGGGGRGWGRGQRPPSRALTWNMDHGEAASISLHRWHMNAWGLHLATAALRAYRLSHCCSRCLQAEPAYMLTSGGGGVRSEPHDMQHHTHPPPAVAAPQQPRSPCPHRPTSVPSRACTGWRSTGGDCAGQLVLLGQEARITSPLAAR